MLFLISLFILQMPPSPIAENLGRHVPLTPKTPFQFRQNLQNLQVVFSFIGFGEGRPSLDWFMCSKAHFVSIGSPFHA